MSAKISLTGKPTEYAFTSDLSYHYPPKLMATVLETDGVPLDIQKEIDDSITAAGLQEGEYCIHYALSNAQNPVITGASIIYYTPQYREDIESSLVSIICGTTTWDGVRRILEILEGVDFPKMPTNLVFDYRTGVTASFHQLDLSFIWNRDVLPFGYKLLKDNRLDHAYLIGLAKNKSTEIVLKALAGAATTAMPAFKGKFHFIS